MNFGVVPDCSLKQSLSQLSFEHHQLLWDWAVEACISIRYRCCCYCYCHFLRRRTLLVFACSHVTYGLDDGAQMSESQAISERKQVALYSRSGLQVNRI